VINMTPANKLFRLGREAPRKVGMVGARSEVGVKSPVFPALAVIDPDPR